MGYHELDFLSEIYLLSRLLRLHDVEGTIIILVCVLFASTGAFMQSSTFWWVCYNIAMVVRGQLYSETSSLVKRNR